MFDHMGFSVRDFARSREFYLKATAPLGITVGGSGEDWMALGRDGQGLWIGAGEAPSASIFGAPKVCGPEPRPPLDYYEFGRL